MPEELTDKIKAEMIKFAKKHDISSIHKTSHEDNSGIIYCFVKAGYRFDNKFENVVTELNARLFPDSGTTIMCSPVAPTNSEVVYERE